MESIPPAYVARARIFKHIRSPRIDSKESIPPAYVACRAGTTTYSFPSPHRLFKNSSSGEPVQQIGLSYRPARLGVDSWAQEQLGYGNA
jgi:hypothetical protein